MADTNKKVSELETASQVNNNDLVMLSQGSSQSGFASLKTTILAIAQKIVSGINFSSDLQTEDKTITGAINEVASGGGGSSTFAGLSDVDIDDTTLANGQVPVWNSTTEKWENNNGGGGTTVIANPTGTPTDELNSIQIGNDIYEIVGGGSGGGSNPAYSTNETSYCAWIDGTTVYQKTFTVDGDGTTREFTVQTGITNGKRLVNAHVSGLRWDSASRWWSPCYINIDNFSWSTHFSLNSDFSEFIVKANQFPLKNITVTLYYTKTDDVPYHGGGSGGHTIKDDSGTSLTQRDNLQFKGVYVEDNQANDVTKVDIVREFQSVAEIEALTGEAKKGFEVIEDTEEYIPYTGSDILFDNTDTSFEGENVQEVLEEVDTALDDIAEQISISDTGYTMGATCYKIGKLVIISCYVIDYPANGILLTLPNDLKPSSNVSLGREWLMTDSSNWGSKEFILFPSGNIGCASAIYRGSVKLFYYTS